MTKNVLIIDDDLDLVESLSIRLTFEGYQTKMATEALGALRQLQAYLPDVILCDWQMPNLNGNEILREVRLSHRTEHVPFIVITGQEIVDSDFQPTAILQKPISIPTLCDLIEKSVGYANV